MSQHDIVKYLKECNEWVKCDDISKALNLSLGSVSTSLRKLRQFGMVNTLYNQRLDTRYYKCKGE